MMFNSVGFLAFFAVSGFLYYLFPKKAQWVLLLIFSVFFYLSAERAAVFFLVLNILSTWSGALLTGRVSGAAAKRFLLASVLLLNLGILFLLKYYGYFAGILNAFAGRMSVSASLPVFSLALPLGISFYTMQTAGYCIDVYRGNYPAERNPAKYALFVLFFPAILQGPIGRYDALAHQFTEPHEFDEKRIVSGLELMLWGYFKKVVVADRAAILVDQVYGHLQDYAGFELAVAAVFYSLQLYADFSGYMDIASGAAEFFGIGIARNFERPYFAKSIQDFWRRWHMTLSFWLRDYLYIPLGGNRKGKVRKYCNLLIVFLVSGLWHGVGIHYVVWGLLHGLYQAAGSLLAPVRKRAAALLKIDRSCLSHRMFQAGFTFSLVTLNWVFFRAPYVSTAVQFLWSMFSAFNPWVLFDGSLYSMGLNAKNFWLTVLSFGLMFLIGLLQRKHRLREELGKQNLPFRWGVCMAGIFAVLLLGVYGQGYSAADFIYMQF